MEERYKHVIDTLINQRNVAQNLVADMSGEIGMLQSMLSERDRRIVELENAIPKKEETRARKSRKKTPLTD